MGTHLRVLNESYPMNTNMTGFKLFFKNLIILVHWMKVYSLSIGRLRDNTGHYNKLVVKMQAG